MGAYRKPDSGTQLGGMGRTSTSLEGLLQQAWLQSQSRPKVARRSAAGDPLTTDGAANCRSRSTASSAQSVAHLMSATSAENASDCDQTFFHKTRASEDQVPPEFLKRRATPRLESYSMKTDVPRSRYVYQNTPSDFRSISPGGSVCDRATTYQDSSSSVFSSSEPGISSSVSNLYNGLSNENPHDLFDAADSTDLAIETEVLDHYFDQFLSNDKLAIEKCLMQLTTAAHAAKKHQKDGVVGIDSDLGCADWSSPKYLTVEEMKASIMATDAYQTMVSELASLLSSSDQSKLLDDSDYVKVDDQVHRPSTGNGAVEIFEPSEELTAFKIMEGFTCMMSRHIQDVLSVSNAGAVDPRNWITEDADRIDAFFDDAWKTYFENCHLSVPKNYTSSESSNVFHEGAGLNNLSEASAGGSAPPSCSSMMELMYRCAFAVSRGDASNATECLEELRRHSSPYGNSMGRLAHHVREALIARMSGTGEELYTVITNNHPSAETMLRAYRVYVDNSPYIKLKHFLSTKSILDAFEGADRVHVVQYGALFGTEWPSLLKHLSMRPGGPPHFRLTGIDIPYPGDDPLKKLLGMGRRLEQFAKQYRVPFEFQALAGNFESFTAKDINLRKGEVLAVSSNRTHLIHDESVVGASPRELLLRRIRSLNPKVMVLYVDSAACNAPFFMTRFRESVKHYAALYDSVEMAFAPDAPERVILEREVLGRELLNIIACEGSARIERAEPYRQWQNRMERADFVLRPLDSIVFSKVKAMMASFHRDFGIGKDGGWLVMGIKNQITCASGVWEPKAAMRFIKK